MRQSAGRANQRPEPPTEVATVRASMLLPDRRSDLDILISPAVGALHALLRVSSPPLVGTLDIVVGEQGVSFFIHYN